MMLPMPIVLAMLAAAPAVPDHDFLDDGRVDRLESTVASLRSALAAAKAEEVRLTGVLAAERRARAAAEADAAAARTRLATLEKAAADKVRPPDVRGAVPRSLIYHLMTPSGQLVGEVSLPTGATVIGYDPTTRRLHYIPPP